jgi:DNA-binding response OmpR family regulator
MAGGWRFWLRALIRRGSLAAAHCGTPDINGYDVARRMRSEGWGAAAFLLAITGWGQRNDKERAKEAGVDQHLTKPVDVDQIAQSLGSFLRHRRTAASRAPQRRAADR